MIVSGKRPKIRASSCVCLILAQRPAGTSRPIITSAGTNAESRPVMANRQRFHFLTNGSPEAASEIPHTDRQHYFIIEVSYPNVIFNNVGRKRKAFRLHWRRRVSFAAFAPRRSAITHQCFRTLSIFRFDWFRLGVHLNDGLHDIRLHRNHLSLSTLILPISPVIVGRGSLDFVHRFPKPFKPFTFPSEIPLSFIMLYNIFPPRTT